MPEIFHPYASFGHQSKIPMRFEADVFECEVEGEIPAEIPVTRASEWTVRGVALKKVNGREFVTGGHAYTPDVVRPRLQFGHVIRPSGYAGRRRSRSPTSFSTCCAWAATT